MTRNKYRTHNCGELRLADAGKEVKISGWVNSVRNLGGLTFMTLRDHFGITQVILDGQVPNTTSKDYFDATLIIFLFIDAASKIS